VQPLLTIANIRIIERNSGTRQAVFTLRLSTPGTQPVAVHYATADGTARAGQDYTAAAGDLTFAPGETARTIGVAVRGDTLDERDETFFVNLSNVAGAVLARTRAAGTIQDDDPPRITISNARVLEGATGAVAGAIFTVKLSTPSSEVVTVSYATANGIASAGSDYLTASGTLSFAPGTTSLTINVRVKGDSLHEADETFAVNLSAATNATIADARGVGLIVNDD
jgi:large repetitive protein